MKPIAPKVDDMNEPSAAASPARRIDALDVVRGFALIGIFMMNVEYFNRPIATLGRGMAPGLSGIDWWASWFVAYFVEGKFWTIFSLLFGMGFAVMLQRAEGAGREFKRPYLRRVLALAVFGALHFVFLWDGDILLTYAVAAAMLMVALHATPRPLLLTVAAVAGLGFLPEQKHFFAVAGGLASAGLIALHLRSDKRVRLPRGVAVPLFAFILMLLGALMSVAAAVLWLLPNTPPEPRLPLSVMGPVVLLAGAAAWRWREPAEQRSLRLGIGLYLLVATSMTLGGLLQHFGPDPYVVSAQATPQAAAKVAERVAEREKRLAELKTEEKREVQVLTQGRYVDAVWLRAEQFVDKLAQDFATALLFIGVFLIGGAFVRSGVIAHSAAHGPLFRRLAWVGLPVGIGLGLLGSLLAMSHVPGDRTDGWGIARGLLMLGNLAACVGYVGLVVLMLNSRGAWSKIGVLAAPGRMALTNYLTQSLVCAVVFHGYGLGLWGLPRAQQLLFVLVVFSAQIAFSHWWLSKFRYGPLEWFWRAFTYRETPPFRR
jgi:uncharacterized protein